VEKGGGDERGILKFEAREKGVAENGKRSRQWIL